jgi:hypothetical protein
MARPPITQILVLTASLAALAAAPSAMARSDPGAIEFWSVPRRGANCQSRRVTPEYWRAARRAHIEFIRLIPDEWPTRRRDFLIGDAGAFDSLDRQDLATVRRALDDAHAAGVRVVLTCFSLPGARWRQLNGDQDDTRLWTHDGFRAQAFSFWRQLATEVRGHPAIVAYNPLNEPHPERAFGMVDPDSATFAEWYREHRGTLADLNDFNREVVAAIRSADPTTPILLDGWFHASASGLMFLEPVADKGILNAFHDYELGTAPLGEAYWKAVEAGTDPETLKMRGPNPLWDVLAKALNRSR